MCGYSWRTYTVQRRMVLPVGHRCRRLEHGVELVRLHGTGMLPTHAWRMYRVRMRR
jgi:hypothetical protein